MYGALDISTSALTAQRANMNAIAGNIANIWTTRGEGGEPYRRRIPIFQSGNPAAGQNASGVHVDKIVKSEDPFRRVYDPSHPDAIQSGKESGYVLYPNVHLGTEMVNAMMAARAYEANVAVTEVTKSMAASLLRTLA
jgi:flagellar basal-body rod protein FlgC